CANLIYTMVLFFFQAEDGIRDFHVTGVQTCALPISTIFVPQPASSRSPPSWWTASSRTTSACCHAAATSWLSVIARPCAKPSPRSEERRVGKEGGRERAASAPGQRADTSWRRLDVRM